MLDALACVTVSKWMRPRPSGLCQDVASGRCACGCNDQLDQKEERRPAALFAGNASVRRVRA